MPSIGTDHWYTPQNQVGNLVDAHFKRYNIADLPRWYSPTLAGMLVTAQLIRLHSEPEATVKFVDGPKNLNLDDRPELPKHGLVAVIGPENLHELTGDVRGPNEMLWDQGTVEEAMRFNRVGEKLRDVVLEMYQLQ